jgi:hypothetical protein
MRQGVRIMKVRRGRLGRDVHQRRRTDAAHLVFLLELGHVHADETLDPEKEIIT